MKVIRCMWWWMLLLLVGCGRGEPAGFPQPLLPTRAELAHVPSPTANFVIDINGLPATFTPVPDLTATPTATEKPPATPTLEPSPTSTPTHTPTATPDVIPGFIGVGTTSIPWRDFAPTSTACDGTGVFYRSQFQSHLGWRTYSAYIPPCYDDGFAYPVLYLFHGSIQTDSHWLDLGLADHVDAGIASGRYPPFIVIMPFNGEVGNMTSGGRRSPEAVTVDYLLPFVDRTFCTWTAASGRSLGGISRGGYWALEIAFRHTDKFTSVAGHSSHLRFETDVATYNPLATYATADLSRMRIWMDWGETDFLRAGQEQLRDSLAQAGIPADVTVFPGGHNDIYWQIHLRDYLDWHAAAWSRSRTAYPACGG